MEGYKKLGEKRKTHVIEVWSIPLKTHIFDVTKLRKVSVSPVRSGSGLLVQEVKERERQSQMLEASGMLTSPTSFNGDYDSNLEASSDTSDTNEKNQKFRKITKFSKPNFSIFDYSDIEREQLESEIEKLINQDGFYDEVSPDDSDVVYKKDKVTKKALFVTITFVLLAISFVFLFMSIKNF